MVGILVALFFVLGILLVVPLWYAEYERKRREEHRQQEESTKSWATMRRQSVEQEIMSRLKTYIKVRDTRGDDVLDHFARSNSDTVFLADLLPADSFRQT